MASIKFLNNITLVGNQLELARIQNLASDPTAYGDGQLYYNTATDKLRLRADGAWVNITTGADDDTTYDLEGFGSSNGTAGIQLVGSDGTTDQVTIQGANGTTVTRSSNTITVTGATINNSTITLTAGDGLTTGGNFTLNQATNKEITFDIDYEGTDNIILSASDEDGNTIATNDKIIYSDSNDSSNVKYGSVSDLPFTNNQGDVTDIQAGDFIIVTDPGGPSPEVAVDATTNSATASKVVARDASGFAYAATPTSGDSSLKLATTAFVQNTLVGLLEFKGGFNANTGAIDGGGNLTSGGSRVAVAVGDMYVVTVAGDFFGNSATPLTPGDSVICQEAAAAGTSVEADFIVVQSDTDLATLSTVGIGNVNASTGILVSYSNGTATVTNADLGSSQDIFKTIAVSGQSNIVADSNSDTLTFAAGGATSITTNASTDTVTISSVNTEYSAMTTSTLGLGKIRYDNNSTPAANSQSTTTGRTYGVTKNSSDQLIVNVPWTDNSGPVDDVTAMTTNNKKGITVSPTTGNVQVGLSISGLPGSAILADDDVFAAYDDSANSNAKFTATAIKTYIGDTRTFSNTGPSSAGTSYTISAATHGLGIDSTLISVQLIEVSTGNTIFADVNRGANGLITISFAQSQGVDSVKALLSLHA